MSFEVEVYEGGELTKVASWPFLELVREGMTTLLGRALDHASVAAVIVDVPEDDVRRGEPELINLLPSYGYLVVLVLEEDSVSYRHPHSVDEVLAGPMRARLRALQPAGPLFYRILGPGLPRGIVSRPAPAVRGVAEVAPFTDGERPAFRISRVRDPEPPPADLSQFAVQAPDPPDSPDSIDREAPIKVVVQASVARDLVEARTFSREVEEGGFLVGRVFGDRGSPGAYIVEITEALAAEYSGASLLHFTFTGDSFEAVKRALRVRAAGEILIGWYHTHLFAAKEEMGLSSIDLKLHFTTFRRPFQLAGLINIEGTSRTLRFYVRQGDTMRRCPQWIFDERK